MKTEPNDEEWTPETTSHRARKANQTNVQEEFGKSAPGVDEGIEVRTKFPVARIKRIMQADEDVGKVAQVTPTAVCKSSKAQSLPHHRQRRMNAKGSLFD